MKLEIPGQFRGRDARSVMPSAIRLRREFESAFKDLGDEPIWVIAPTLRIGGELGEFGEEGIENLQVAEGEAACDVIISAQAWGDMSDAEIYTFIQPKVIDALRMLLAEVELPSRMR